MAEQVKRARRTAKAKAKGRPAAKAKRPVGRAKPEPAKRRRGRPSLPPSEVVNVRMPLALIERIDRYVDSERSWTNAVATNRAQLVRTAVDQFLCDTGYETS